MAVAGQLNHSLVPGDLQLPAWGPYTKTYAGVSHLPELERGVRFDLSVFPGLYRRRQTPPNVKVDSGCYAWRADPGLGTYTYRHMLGEGESLYAETTYSTHGSGRLIRIRFFNRTNLPQQLSLHYLASLNFPEIGPGHRPPLQPAEVALPEGAAWIDGSHYQSLVLDENAPQRHLPDNAEIWGEVRGDGFVHGTGLGQGFGGAAGHKVVYALPEGFARAGSVALMRYRLTGAAGASLRISGAYADTLTLPRAERWQLAAIPVGDATADSFQVEPAGDAELEIDGFALVQRDRMSRVGFSEPPLEYRPKINRLEHEDALTLEYASIAGSYGIAWAGKDSEVREWLTDNLDYDFPFFTHDHVRAMIDRGGRRHYTHIFIRPVFLAAGETKELQGYICHAAAADEVTGMLRRFQANANGRSMAGEQERPTILPAHTDSGRAYAYGVERLAATLSTNIVYPVRRFGRYIRHYTPGRWWDSLYTWDAGFIGLGLLELDPARAVDNLAAYLTEPGDDAAFVHHGSPVPVQIYQLHGLWNQTQDRALLRRFFPGACRMHRFLAGRGDGSRIDTLASGLLRTWDYFYNSGGWDDYPPQKHIRGTTLTRTIAPVINSAHAIRTARLLRDMAVLLEQPTREFDADIARLTEALQTHSWNPASGWFSYVRHDDAGRAIGPLRHESGADYNRGLDGIYPLVAGICTREQETLFVGRLRDAGVFWAPCGLSTVDQGAPYFRVDGYWNGAVWMPHQWFFWKTLLDLGEGELAWRIARTALETWEREVRATGCCFEHFIIHTGRGGGWHQFGGLSAPILSWFAAYFRPGALTGGFDLLVLSKAYTGNALRARLRLSGPPEKSPVVLAVVPGATCATWQGCRVPVNSICPGTLEIRLPKGSDEGELAVD